GRGDDGVMVWVNGQLVGNNPGLHGTIDGASNPITLTAGQSYPVVMVFAEFGGDAGASLRWSTPSVPGSIVPVPLSATTADSDLPTASTLTGAPSPTSVSLTWTDNALNDYENFVQYSADGGNTWITTQKFLLLEN